MGQATVIVFVQRFWCLVVTRNKNETSKKKIINCMNGISVMECSMIVTTHGRRFDNVQKKNEPYLSVELIQRNAVCEIIPVLESIEARDQAMMNVQLALRNTYPSLAPFVNSCSLAVPPTHASYLSYTLCQACMGIVFFLFTIRTSTETRDEGYVDVVACNGRKERETEDFYRYQPLVLYPLLIRRPSHIKINRRMSPPIIEPTPA